MFPISPGAIIWCVGAVAWIMTLIVCICCMGMVARSDKTIIILDLVVLLFVQCAMIGLMIIGDHLMITENFQILQEQQQKAAVTSNQK